MIPLFDYVDTLKFYLGGIRMSFIIVICSSAIFPPHDYQWLRRFSFRLFLWLIMQYLAVINGDGRVREAGNQNLIYPGISKCKILIVRAIEITPSTS